MTTELKKESELIQLIPEEEETSSLKKNLVIASLVSSMTLIALSTSVLTPFYPKEAHKRGATSAQYGFVFGALEMISFAAGVPVGRVSDKVSPRSLLMTGLISQILALVIFSVLHIVKDLYIFLGVSFTSRVLSGFAKSIVNVSMFSFGPLMFPEQAATLTSLGEAMYGMGLLMGPLLGGFLYDIQGFYFPFLIIGLLHVPLTPVTWWYMESKVLPKAKGEESESILGGMLRIYDVWVCLFCSAIGSGIVAMDLLSVEPKLRSFGISSSIVGLLFSVGPVVYLSSTFIIGKLCDKGMSEVFFILAGTVLGGTGAALFGYSQEIYQIVLSHVLKSLGMGALFVPSLLYMIRACLKKGFPDDIGTRGTASGMFVAASSLGAIVGYTGGGLLSDAIGITLSYYIIAIIYVGAVLAVLLTLYNSVCSNQQ